MQNRKTYIVVPGCSDLNRGDQALAWETKEFAERAGFVGDYYMISEKNEPTCQSRQQGMESLEPILEHPSTKFKNKKNIDYTKWLKVKWGIISIFDLIWTLCLLVPIIRRIVVFFLSDSKKDTYKKFEEAAAIFMKGGGLLQTYGGIVSTYSMYFWTYTLLLAKSLHKPIYIMPNSFGPFEGPGVKFIAKKALKNVNFISSRESISQDLLENKLGIKSTLLPDLAFFLKPRKIDKDQFFDKFAIPRDKKLVAITVRPYRFPKSAEPNVKYKEYKKTIANFVEYLYKKDYMPIFVQHTLAVNAHEDDGRCIEEIISHIDKTKYRVVFNKNYDSRDLKEIYGFCDYVIGTRFHSMIFSFGMGVPGIAISYVGNKSKGIMKDMGLSNYVISIYDVTIDTLITKFEELLDNEDSVKKRIAKYVYDAQVKRKDIIKKLEN